MSDENSTDHPYKGILKAFKPQEWQLKKQVPQGAPPLEDTNFTFVDTVTLLSDTAAKLKQEKEIAFGVTYGEQVCFHPTCVILAIATRTHTFIIDAKTLKDELKVLNEIFSDENIMKVAFSGRLGIKNQLATTLTRSFGLWVVNFFDNCSAGYLIKGGEDKTTAWSFNKMMKEYCSIEPGRLTWKWDARPLPEDHMVHARKNVHYLLYIQDRLRNQLIEKKLIDKFYDDCRDLCVRTTSDGEAMLTSHDSLLDRFCNIYMRKTQEVTLNKQQLECFKLLFDWRYKTAREHNKPVAQILPKEGLFRLCRTLPREKEGVAKCFTDNMLTPLVDENVKEVHKLVLQAIKNHPSTSIPAQEKTGEKRRQERADLNKSSSKRGRGGAHWRGPMMGRGMGPYGSRMGPGIQNRMGIMDPGICSRMGIIGPRVGPGIGPGMGPGMRRGMGPRMGPRLGPGMGSEMGSGMGSGMGPGIGPRMGKGTAEGLVDMIIEGVAEAINSRSSYSMNNWGWGRGGAHGGGMYGRR